MALCGFAFCWPSRFGNLRICDFQTRTATKFADSRIRHGLTSTKCLLAHLWLVRAELVLWMRFSRVVRASDCQCKSPGFDPSILRHSGIWGAADEAVLNKVHRKKIKKIPLFSYSVFTSTQTSHSLKWSRKKICSVCTSAIPFERGLQCQNRGRERWLSPVCMLLLHVCPFRRMIRFIEQSLMPMPMLGLDYTLCILSPVS